MVLQYVQCKCIEKDTTNAQVKLNKLTVLLLFNASMTCFEEYAAGLQLHHV